MPPESQMWFHMNFMIGVFSSKTLVFILKKAVVMLF